MNHLMFGALVALPALGMILYFIYDLMCCKHNYTILHTYPIVKDFDLGDDDRYHWQRLPATVYHLQCSICGNLKQQTLMGVNQIQISLTSQARRLRCSEGWYVTGVKRRGLRR